jgi:hypothetical protein
MLFKSLRAAINLISTFIYSMHNSQVHKYHQSEISLTLRDLSNFDTAREEGRRKSNNEREERRKPIQAISKTAYPPIPYNHNFVLVKSRRHEPTM